MSAPKTWFPWAPACRFQREDRPRKATRWTVTITDPSEEPEGLASIAGSGDSPAAALDAMLSIVAWWLDYAGTRKGTVGKVYIGEGGR